MRPSVDINMIRTPVCEKIIVKAAEKSNSSTLLFVELSREEFVDEGEGKGVDEGEFGDEGVGLRLCEEGANDDGVPGCGH